MQSGGQEMDIPIVPLIDMAFQLIFFFVITGAEQRVTFDESIKLAQAKYAEPLKSPPPDGVTINIRENGKFNIGNTEYSKRDLQIALKQIYSTDKRDHTETPVVLRCDRNVKYEYVDNVLEIIKKSGMIKVRLVADVAPEAAAK